jgi:uncharacterized protein DUF3489
MTSKPSTTARSSTRPARKTLTPASKRTKAAKSRTRKSAIATPPAPTGTKQSQLLAMLRSPAGGTIAQMTALTGWQPHTVRGTISGVLRKRLQLNVVLDPGTRIYRIIEATS